MAESSETAFSAQESEIMQATHRALREYGYADLTIKRIADEYGKSTAAVHYYYDTKEALLVAFLDYLLEEFVDSIHETETTDPEKRLNRLLDRLITGLEEHRDLSIALMEMRSQAPYKAEFRDRFRQNDEYIRYMLKSVITHGIDEGVFNDVDANHVVEGLMTIVDGARARVVVLDDPAALDTARKTATEYVEAKLHG